MRSRRSRIGVAIWSPALDGLGSPRDVRRAAAVPGLYFLELLWQHSMASASLLGPELNRPHLAETMSQEAFT